MPPIEETDRHSNVASPAAEQSQSWQGFKIVGDNIDKTVGHRYQCLDDASMSLHYFNLCAVMDRIDFSHLSDAMKPLPNPIPFDLLLPSQDDLSSIMSSIGVLVGRILV